MKIINNKKLETVISGLALKVIVLVIWNSLCINPLYASGGQGREQVERQAAGRGSSREKGFLSSLLKSASSFLNSDEKKEGPNLRGSRTSPSLSSSTSRSSIPSFDSHVNPQSLFGENRQTVSTHENEEITYDMEGKEYITQPQKFLVVLNTYKEPFVSVKHKGVRLNLINNGTTSEDFLIDSGSEEHAIFSVNQSDASAKSMTIGVSGKSGVKIQTKVGVNKLKQDAKKVKIFNIKTQAANTKTYFAVKGDETEINLTGGEENNLLFADKKSLAKGSLLEIEKGTAVSLATADNNGAVLLKDGNHLEAKINGAIFIQKGTAFKAEGNSELKLTFDQNSDVKTLVTDNEFLGKIASADKGKIEATFDTNSCASGIFDLGNNEESNVTVSSGVKVAGTYELNKQGVAKSVPINGCDISFIFRRPKQKVLLSSDLKRDVKVIGDKKGRIEALESITIAADVGEATKKEDGRYETKGLQDFTIAEGKFVIIEPKVFVSEKTFLNKNSKVIINLNDQVENRFFSQVLPANKYDNEGSVVRFFWEATSNNSFPLRRDIGDKKKGEIVDSVEISHGVSLASGEAKIAAKKIILQGEKDAPAYLRINGKISQGSQGDIVNNSEHNVVIYEKVQDSTFGKIGERDKKLGNFIVKDAEVNIIHDTYVKKTTLMQSDVDSRVNKIIVDHDNVNLGKIEIKNPEKKAKEDVIVGGELILKKSYTALDEIGLHTPKGKKGSESETQDSSLEKIFVHEDFTIEKPVCAVNGIIAETSDAVINIHTPRIVSPFVAAQNNYGTINVKEDHRFNTKFKNELFTNTFKTLNIEAGTTTLSTQVTELPFNDINIEKDAVLDLQGANTSLITDKNSKNEHFLKVDGILYLGNESHKVEHENITFGPESILFFKKKEDSYSTLAFNNATNINLNGVLLHFVDFDKNFIEKGVDLIFIKNSACVLNIENVEFSGLEIDINKKIPRLEFNAITKAITLLTVARGDGPPTPLRRTRPKMSDELDQKEQKTEQTDQTEPGKDNALEDSKADGRRKRVQKLEQVLEQQEQKKARKLLKKEEERKKQEEAEQEERIKREEEEQERKELEEKARQDEEERKKQEEALKLAQEEAELKGLAAEKARREEEEARIKREEEERKRAQEEQERKDREEEARRLEEERKRQEQVRKEHEEELRKKEEEKARQELEEKARREEEERKKREEAELKAREEEEARKRLEEEDRRQEEERKRQEAEKARRNEEERKKQEEALKLAQEEAERKRLAEEEARIKREDEERKKQEEARKRAQEEQERKELEEKARQQEEERKKDEERKRQEEERKKREEEERKKREEERKKREEEERKKREEDLRLAQEKAERKALKEEARKRAQEEQERKELQEKARREEEERKKREEAELKAREEEEARKRLEEEARRQEEERKKDEERKRQEEERIKREEEERKKREEDLRLAQEKAERKALKEEARKRAQEEQERKELQEKARREEEERKKREEAELKAREEEARKRLEEEARRQEEERKKQEAEKARRNEEERKKQEEALKLAQEEAERKRLAEEEARIKREEEERKRQKEVLRLAQEELVRKFAQEEQKRKELEEQARREEELRKKQEEECRRRAEEVRKQEEERNRALEELRKKYEEDVRRQEEVRKKQEEEAQQQAARMRAAQIPTPPPLPPQGRGQIPNIAQPTINAAILEGIRRNLRPTRLPVQQPIGGGAPPPVPPVVVPPPPPVPPVVAPPPPPAAIPVPPPIPPGGIPGARPAAGAAPAAGGAPPPPPPVPPVVAPLPPPAAIPVPPPIPPGGIPRARPRARAASAAGGAAPVAGGAAAGPGGAAPAAPGAPVVAAPAPAPVAPAAPAPVAAAPPAPARVYYTEDHKRKKEEVKVKPKPRIPFPTSVECSKVLEKHLAKHLEKHLTQNDKNSSEKELHNLAKVLSEMMQNDSQQATKVLQNIIPNHAKNGANYIVSMDIVHSMTVTLLNCIENELANIANDGPRLLTAGIAAGDEDEDRNKKSVYNLWASTITYNTKQKDVDDANGFASNSYGGVGGLTIHPSDNSKIGISLGYSDTKVKENNESSNQGKIQSYNVSLYGDYNAEYWFTRAVLGFTLHNHCNLRGLYSIANPGREGLEGLGWSEALNQSRIAQEKFQTKHFSFLMLAGVKFKRGKTTFSPAFYVDGSSIVTPAHKETGSNNKDARLLSFEASKSSAARFGPQMKIEASLNGPAGWVVKPALTVRLLFSAGSRNYRTIASLNGSADAFIIENRAKIGSTTLEGLGGILFKKERFRIGVAYKRSTRRAFISQMGMITVSMKI